MKNLIRICAIASITSHVAGQNLPDINQVGIAGVKHWANDRITWAKADFMKSNKYTPSLKYWGGEIVYSIQVDRFNDGDFSLNDKNLPPTQSQNQNTNHPYGLPDYRHGGDLQGIIDRLDYIADLGATMLWITPVLKFNGDYHGYCTTDPTMIDTGFGTQDLFRTMVKEAHGRRIYVVMDIVINHLCDRDTSYSKSPDHVNCAAELDAKNWSGEPGGSIKQGELAFGPNFFPPMKLQNFFNRCGPNSDEEMRGEGPAAVYGDFVEGMLDYDTRNWDFQDIFSLIHQYWIAYADIDGFRLDAAKHVSEDFVAAFSTYARAFAASLGKENFYVVGEVAASSKWEGRRLGRMFMNPENPDHHGDVPLALVSRVKNLRTIYSADPVNTYPGLNAIYGFHESGSSRDILQDSKSPKDIVDFYEGDDFKTIAGQNDPRLSWVLLEIHDWPRFASPAPTDPYKSALGLAYLMTLPGMPIIYYGQEQGFSGVCTANIPIDAGDATQSIRDTCASRSDALSRQDMFVTGSWRLSSTVDAISQLAGIGKGLNVTVADWNSDPFLRRDTMVYRAARGAVSVRRSCGPLQWGKIAYRRVDDAVGGLFSFSRFDDMMEVLVVVNPIFSSNKAINKIQIESSLNKVNGARFLNLYNTAQYGNVVMEGGYTYLDLSNVQIGGNSIMMFVEDKHVGEFKTDLEAALCVSAPTALVADSSDDTHTTLHVSLRGANEELE